MKEQNQWQGWEAALTGPAATAPLSPPDIPLKEKASVAAELREFRSASQEQFLTIRQGLKELLQAGSPAVEDKGALLYELLLAWTRQFYNIPDCRSGALLEVAQDLVAAFYRLLAAAPHLGLLAVSFRRPEAGLPGHCLNVSLLGLSYARFYAWPETAARLLGLGALLHDLGMTTLTTAWEKGSPLSGDELEVLRRHPQAGVKLLGPFPQLSGKIFLMVAQHHENADGSGYPLGLPLAAIHPYARLLRILDTFEALTAVRPWRAPLSPDKALACMRYSGAGNAEFDLRLLENFRRFWTRLAAQG